MAARGHRNLLIRDYMPVVADHAARTVRGAAVNGDGRDGAAGPVGPGGRRSGSGWR